MLRIVALCICVVLANANDNDPSYGGIFSTVAPSTYIDPQDYNAPIDKQDSFDWKLSQTVFRSSRDQNVILSPLSVKLLLTILAEAAGQTIASKTRKELEQVLPYNKSLFDAQEHFKKILASIGYQSDEYTVNIATKMFVDKDVSINQRFQAIVQHNYQSDVEALNFADTRRSVQEINKWVSDVTRGHISELVNEAAVANSFILLLNAIYFQGTWRQPFNKTFVAQFNTAPGKRVDKEFIERTGNYYYFNSKHYDAKILRLPYSGRRYSMFVILPNESNNVDNVIDKLDSTTLKNEVWHMDELEVHVVLPKFKFDSSIALNDVVRSLGITDIFENSATFPLLARGGNSEGKLKVSNIIQKSGIVVDEKGTTAWAATEIELINKFGGDPREFVVNRPFLFYIEDDTTGAKLFTGRVNNPQY